MIIFVLGADREREERMTLDSIAAALPGVRTIPVPAGHHLMLNDIVDNSADAVCLTVRAGSRIYPSIRDHVAKWSFCLEKDSLPWIHLLPAPAMQPFHDRFRPGEAGPVLWNLRMMRARGLRFPQASVLPFERMLEWYQMQEMGRALGHSIESAAWVPPRHKLPEWQRREREWRKLAPILLSGPDKVEALTPSVPCPAVSIILAVYNEPDYMQWAVRSVRSQTSGSWELILIDDGSTDETTGLVEKLSADDPSRIRYIRHSRNRGKAAALNTGLQHVRAPWLLELDADDWLEPDIVKRISTFVPSVQPETLLLYGNHSMWKQNEGILSYRGIQHSPVILEINEMLEKGIPVTPRVYRTEAARRLNGWRADDPVQGRLYEDMHMLVRLLQIGSACHLEDCFYNRRLRADSVTRTHQHHYMQWCRWAMETYCLHESQYGYLAT